MVPLQLIIHAESIELVWDREEAERGKWDVTKPFFILDQRTASRDRMSPFSNTITITISLYPALNDLYKTIRSCRRIGSGIIISAIKTMTIEPLVLVLEVSLSTST